MKPIAILTGGSRGIGKAILKRLILAGYECVVIGLLPLTENHEINASYIFRDLTKQDEILKTCEDVRQYLKSFGQPVSLLVNNAGGGWPSKMDDLSIEMVQSDLNLNLVAPMFLSQAVLPSMQEISHGSIVNISSIAGRQGVPFLHSYSASKAGLISFTQSLAAEVAKNGIRVNCVSPGAVDTDSARQGRAELSRLHGLDANVYEQSMINRNGLARLLLPDEVADVVLWLGRTEQRALTGQNINVCGIMMME